MKKDYSKFSLSGAFTSFVLAVLNIVPMTAKADGVLIFGAASLAPVLLNIKSSIKIIRDNHIKFSFASSSSLARQIVWGAPADIFISANTAWMDYAEHKLAIIPRSRRTLLSNRIVLAAHKSVQYNFTTLTLETLDTLLNDGHISLADPGHVPAGIYGKQALRTLGLWNFVKGRLALAGNARAALALVERNEAPIGILYRTDVLNSEKVKTIFTFSQDIHRKVNYVIAIVQGKSTPTVQKVYDFLLGPKAKLIFSKYGFEIS